MNSEVQKYIVQRKSAGISDLEIRTELKQAGWNDAQINSVLPFVQSGTQGSRMKYIIITAAVFFVLAGAAAAMYFFVLKKDDGSTNTNTVLHKNTNTVNNTNVAANVNTTTNTNTTSTNPSTKDGWLKFKDAKNGYTIDFPENYRLEEGSNYIQLFSYPAENNYNPGAPVPTNELKISLSLYSGINQTVQEWVTSNVEPTKTEAFTIDGKNALKVWITDTLMGSTFNYLRIYFVDQSNGVIMSAWPYNSELLEDFYNIASTFTFLDETAGWVTYTSNDYKYSLQHPNEWKEKSASSEGVFDFYVDIVPANPSESNVELKVRVTPFTIRTGETLNEAYKRTTGSDVSSLTSEIISVDGIQGRYYENIPSFLNYNAVLVQNGSMGYEIEDHTSREIFDLVLSTFQFIN